MVISKTFITFILAVVYFFAVNLNCQAAEDSSSRVNNKSYPYVDMSIFGGIRYGSDCSSVGTTVNQDIKVDLREYLINLKDMLIGECSEWKFDHVKNTYKPVQICFRIYKDGEIADARIEHSSGDKKVDQAALDTVANCPKWTSLPDGCPDYLVFSFSLDSSSTKSLFCEPAIIEFGRNRTQLAKEYFDEMRRKIELHWSPPKDAPSPHAGFVVHKNGSISEIEIMTSGEQLADQAALTAIKSAAPFAPIPYGLEDDYSISFSFDYR